MKNREMENSGGKQDGRYQKKRAGADREHAGTEG